MTTLKSGKKGEPTPPKSKSRLLLEIKREEKKKAPARKREKEKSPLAGNKEEKGKVSLSETKELSPN